MNNPIVVLQCNHYNQTRHILHTLKLKGYTWASLKDLEEYIPYGLEHPRHMINIVINPTRKIIFYNNNRYGGLADSDGVNYVLEVN